MLDPALFSNLSAPAHELKLYLQLSEGDIWIVSSGSIFSTVMSRSY